MSYMCHLWWVLLAISRLFYEHLSMIDAFSFIEGLAFNWNRSWHNCCSDRGKIDICCYNLHITIVTICTSTNALAIGNTAGDWEHSWWIYIEKRSPKALKLTPHSKQNQLTSVVFKSTLLSAPLSCQILLGMMIRRRNNKSKCYVLRVDLYEAF